jgi:hypothetical protein
MEFMCTYRVGFPCLESLFLVCLNFKWKCQLGQSRSSQCVAGFIILEMTIVMEAATHCGNLEGLKS